MERASRLKKGNRVWLKTKASYFGFVLRVPVTLLEDGREGARLIKTKLTRPDTGEEVTKYEPVASLETDEELEKGNYKEIEELRDKVKSMEEAESLLDKECQKSSRLENELEGMKKEVQHKHEQLQKLMEHSEALGNDLKGRMEEIKQLKKLTTELAMKNPPSTAEDKEQTAKEAITVQGK